MRRLLPLAALVASCATPPEPADLVVLGGEVVTLDASTPRAEAVAVRGGRIVAVGTGDDVLPLVGGGTEVIDVQGASVLPGFIDSHAHLEGLGRALVHLDLRDAGTWDEVVARVAEAAGRTPPGNWVLGWGWHQEKWSAPPSPSVEGYPVHEALSRAVPDQPVLLKHAAGSHMGIANARALSAAGIDASTPDPPGGEFLRDGLGRLTGVLRETAYEVVIAAHDADQAARSPEETEAEERRRLDLAIEHALSLGVTTLHDAGTTFATLDRLRGMEAGGDLRLRVWAMLSEDDEAIRFRLDTLPRNADGSGMLTARAIKREMDGALGSHGAWLLEPYADRPGQSGLNTTPVETIEASARFAAEHGFQMAVHAIGTRANRETLDLYERILGELPDGRDRRWRIEHAQHLHRDDVPRFARLGVVAAMQGIHCTSDGPWVAERLGDRRARESSYLWRSLLASGAIVANGTDAPVEALDPMPNLHATIARRLADGTTFVPEQRMTREEALRSYTLAAAYAGFEENEKGSIAVGKLADLVVLDRDILSIPEDEIPGAKVLWTIVAGRVVYRSPAAAPR